MSKYHNENTIYIKTFTLLVSNLEASIKFYLDTLKLSLIKKDENSAYLGVSDKILFKLISSNKTIKKEKTTGLYHFALLLNKRSDFANLVKHFIKEKIKVTGSADHGVSEAIYLNDPDENGIEIYFDKDESLWPVIDKELKMTTDVIYFDELLKLSDNNEFKMPDDTIIGHMHFHVSNLKEANDFFTNVLGFSMSQNMHSAHFLSDNNYHHHLGLNIWNGINIIDRKENMVGLINYTVNIPSNKKAIFLKRLEDLNIKIYKDLNKSYIIDPNLVRVYF